MSNLSSADEHLLAPVVGRLNIDNEVAVAHADVLDLDVELVARQNHADEGDIVTRNEEWPSETILIMLQICDTYATTRSGRP